MSGPKCGAKGRSGRPCGLPAGHGTDHVGEGRCRRHGGATPVKHGRYSTITRPRIAELVAQFAADPEPLNIRSELDLLRALTLDFIERYDAFTEALIAWHESFGSDEGNPKPTQVIDIADAARLIDRIARVVEIIDKQKQKGALSLETLQRVMESFGAIVAKHVKEPAALQAIEREWGQVAL